MNVRAVITGVAVLVAPVATAEAQTVSDCVHTSEQGQAQRTRGELRAARESFVACGRDYCPVPLRRDCAGWLEEVDGEIPSVVFGARDAEGHDLFDAKITVDRTLRADSASGRAIQLDPGAHEARFERAGAPPLTERFLLRAGERNHPVVATFPAPPRKREISPWVFVFGGIGVAGLGSFATFGILGLQEKSSLRSTCGSSSPSGSPCSDSQLSTLKTRFAVADVSLGVAVVSIAVAGAFLLFAPGSPAKGAEAHAGPSLRVDLEGARVAF